MKFLKSAFAAAGLCVALGLAFLPSGAFAADSAVVIVYHRFGEGTLPSTNIRLGQFEAQIRELKSGPYTVLPLPEIVKALKSGRPLPERTVGISIDDAYLSAYTQAWPRLREAGLPFTVFVATGPVDQKLENYMTWDQIREMAAAGVTIGNHSVTHLHMPTASATRNISEVDDAARRFEEELAVKPTLFSYPYGEASAPVEALARKKGFAAAFGQHSGVIDGGGNFFYLPRFALNETYGEIGRFRLLANALPLPVADATPEDPFIGKDAANPPTIGFTVTEKIANLDRITCFLSYEGAVAVEVLGGVRVEVRAKTPFPTGRTRLNCTLPGPDGRWRWFGRQFYKPY